MQIIDTHFAGLKVIIPKVFQDERGYFFESYNQKRYEEKGINLHFYQDNEAFSTYGVIRGLHYQKGGHAQGKLVRVVFGEVLDIAVDLRKDEKTFGQTFSLIINDINKKQLYIPPGFAHGYVVLSKNALFSYKCTQYYNPSSEAGIHPLDPELNIDWMVSPEKRIIAEKDLAFPFFDSNKTIF
jgi:dTDP-4-dehydrorhamnose 3,5-epimerase